MNTSEHRTLLMSGVGIVAAAILVVAVVSGGSNTSTSPNDSTSSSSSSLVDIEPVTSVPGTDSSTAPGTDPVDITGEEPTGDEPCVMTVRSLAGGDTGLSVTCLQEALIVAGFLDSAATGVYDNATAAAVEKLQVDRDLFVDGKTGRETALSLGVWPDENSLVIRTPPPTPGAVDLLGYELSSVATSGPDAPPLPPNSGSGRRLVFERAGQRIWAVGEDNVVIRSWLVSGSKYNNETPGTHAVYSRSDVSTAWNGKAFLYKMVRWLKTDIGAIGFHATHSSR